MDRWGRFMAGLRRADKYRARGEWGAVRAELYYAVRYLLTGKRPGEAVFGSQETFDARKRKRIEKQVQDQMAREDDEEDEFRHCPECGSLLMLSNVWPHERWLCTLCEYVEDDV